MACLDLNDLYVRSRTVERRTGVPIDKLWKYIDRSHPPNTFQTRQVAKTFPLSSSCGVLGSK
jgi:hypothetical protein